MAANDTGASCVAIAKTLCVLDTAFYRGSRKFERLPSQESNPMSTININADTASIRVSPSKRALLSVPRGGSAE
jgi:hypothetical protein